MGLTDGSACEITAARIRASLGPLPSCDMCLRVREMHRWASAARRVCARVLGGVLLWVVRMTKFRQPGQIAPHHIAELIVIGCMGARRNDEPGETVWGEAGHDHFDHRHQGASGQAGSAVTWHTATQPNKHN